MSKSRILSFLGTCIIAGIVMLLMKEVVTLKEENNKLKVDNNSLNVHIGELEDDAWYLRENIKAQQSNIDALNEEIKNHKDLNTQLQNGNSTLTEELKKSKAEAEELRRKATASSTMPSRGGEAKKTMYMTATAYIALCDTGCTGITATGINLLKNPDAKVIAVDPNIIPLGTKVHVEGYGYAVAGDTGGAIRGGKIDIYVRTTHEAKNWGVRTVKVTILK